MVDQIDLQPCGWFQNPKAEHGQRLLETSVHSHHPFATFRWRPYRCGGAPLVIDELSLHTVASLHR